MTRTLTVSRDVGDDRMLLIELPEHAPTGCVAVALAHGDLDEGQAATGGQARLQTLGDILDSDLFGLWADRDDIGDSVEFARQLREEAWQSKP